MIRIIAKRYAKALVQLAEEKKSVDQTRADLAAFVGAVDTLPAMQKLFASPVLPPESKKAVIGELAGKLNLQKTTQRFLEHLAETGRIRYIKDLHEAFLDILAQRQNRATVRLTTAAPLNNGDMADIKKKLEILTGKQVDIDSKVDASLIGGAKAQIGSTIYDGTIKNQLDKMRMKLVN
ncbi:MAG TPA: ATP synthase F1 subunit delta [Nitrospirota bacterium]